MSEPASSVDESGTVVMRCERMALVECFNHTLLISEGVGLIYVCRLVRLKNEPTLRLAIWVHQRLTPSMHSAFSDLLSINQATNLPAQFS